MEEELDSVIKVLAKLSWSYARMYPEFEFDDLLSEAILAYLNARSKYDPERGARTTFATVTARNHLNSFLQCQQKLKEKMVESAFDAIPEDRCHPVFPSPYHRSPEELAIIRETWMEIVYSLSSDAKEVYRTLSDLPEEDYRKPRKARGKVVKLLRGKGWSWGRIWKVFREVKKFTVTP